MLDKAILEVVEGRELEPLQMEAAMAEVLSGEAEPAQIAALMVALRMRGETPAELAAAARALRAQCERVDLEMSPLFDTCGTGGDGASTFNISTTAAIVLASCGVAVAKHGNRAVSSRCGSADVLEALGVAIDLPKADVAQCIREVGIGFLFAPAHHAALRHAAPVRKLLKLRSFFNLLGPLANPAAATHQVVGVYDPTRVTQMAEVLKLLGVQGAWVVHGEGGLDEISPFGETQVACLAAGEVTTRTVCPESFGLEPVSPESIAGGDAKTNADITRRVLSGEPGGPRTAVLLNVAAALLVAGRVTSLEAGVAMAAAHLDDGHAAQILAEWAALTQGLKAMKASDG